MGLSTTTSTALAAYEMADQLRAQGVPVVIGGSHVTFMANEALEHADYVARGEGGEQLMAELIEALSGDRELDSIAGLSFRRDGMLEGASVSGRSRICTQAPATSHPLARLSWVFPKRARLPAHRSAGADRLLFCEQESARH